MKRSKSNPSIKVSPNDAETKRSDDLLLIVGVGASAGGLEAFSQFLGSLREDTGMTYVLVQHLDPHHETRLSDLLSKVTRLPIQEATQDLVVKPNHVYIIPPNMSMTIAEGVLKLTPRENAVSPFLPIDHFFHSLAEDQKDRSIGVILSGTGTDGTRGLEEIKAAGGITFAQDQGTAKFPSMPQNAIQTGCVDFILPPSDISQELTRIGRHPYMGSGSAQGQAADQEDHYRKILALLRSAAGVDFSSYRDTTIKRRIMRRMVLHTKESLADYIDLLERKPTEVEALYHDLLINVTSFFREPETFEALKASVFPELLKTKESNPLLRIWVPGCSTGQEAYSLAIVLLEFLSDKAVHSTIQIFATDLSEGESLRKAREGVYPESIESEVSPERLRRFFIKEDGKYRISKHIREMCVFAKHNVTADPPFSHMDLISCRNLLIYLALPLQRRVIPTFHYALNPGGFLLLGASETIGVFTDLFGAVDQVLRIYCKKAVTVREYPHFAATGFSSGISKNMQNNPLVATPMEWQREADRIVLTKYAPTGVLVNDNMEILQFRGKTGAYLEAPSGEPSHNLLRMASDGLFSALRQTISECRQKNMAVHRQGVRIRRNEQIREIAIRVLPVKLPGSDECCFLILFEESGQASNPSLPLGVSSTPESDDAAQLRQELVSMQEYLQSVIEQKDTINEELRATNEESLSSNEELQSTNEELETAKEELQSVNEELTTVNEQLNYRNKELSQLNDKLQEARDYAKAIVETVRDPLIVLDANLRVQMANLAFYKTFDTTPEKTENHVLYELGNRQWDIPELRRMLESILLRQTTLTDFEVSHTFESIGAKTMLLNASTVIRHNSEAPLVLLAIEDISERKWLEEELRKSSKKLAEADHRKDEFIATLSHELRNPLAPLRNAWEVLQLPDVTSEIVLQAHNIMGRQLTHMARLVDDLLDISRITSGKIELRKERIELEKIVKSAIESSRPLIDGAGHKLAVALPDKPLWLDVDPARMAQVFGNLLSNAAKYTGKNGSIELSAESKENTIIVHVKDNGVGLSPNMLSPIFDMFSQVDASIERAQGGLGIGLALVKSLVEMHGGSIRAASAGIGHGSEFIVCLPLGSAPDPADSQSQKNEQIIVEEASGRRFLVVDDNEETAKTTGWLLELMLGHEIRLAHDGVSAIAIARSFLPDLVLLDIGLPGMNGYEVCRAMRKEPLLKHTKIVAQTGWGQQEHRQRTKEAGFDYHLVKPITENSLQEALDSLKAQTNISMA